MNKKYIKIERLIEKLKSSGKIRLASAEFRFYSESVAEESLKKLEGIEVESSIISFYQQVDFIDLQWYPADDAQLKFLDKDIDIIGGSLIIPTFSMLVDSILKRNSQSVIDPYKNLNEKEYHSLRDYFVFDRLNGDGAVCFQLQNGVLKDKLFLISTGSIGFIQPLNCNCDSYFENGYEFWFFNQWQEAFYLNSPKANKQLAFYLPQFKNADR